MRASGRLGARAGRRSRAHVESAGLAALVGKPADPLAQEVAATRGLDLSQHRARQLTPDMVRDFDLVLVMEDEHVRMVESAIPAMRGRVHRIGRFGGFDVPDPYRRGPEAFANALALIESGLDEYARRFWGN